MTDALGLLGSCSLLVLPGCWLAFSVPLGSSSFLARTALAVVLSPIVVLAEFYLLRVAGLPFGATALALVVLNLPAAYLIVRQRTAVRLPSPGTIAVWGGPLLFVAAYLLLWLYDPQARSNWRHNWLHSDIIYMLANGQLRPEEPQLAGIRLAYPWFGHVFQGVVSFVRGTPPASSFMLTNTAWLLAVFVLVVELVRDLGGRVAARASSIALLGFGVNFLGLAARDLLPAGVLDAYPAWGDPRYSPWLRKFGVFESTILGVGIFAALIYFLARDDRSVPYRARAALTSLLLVSAALLYPLLWPACAAVVGAYVLAGFGSWFSSATLRRELVLMSSGLGVAAFVLLGYLNLATVDRGGDPSMGLSHPYWMRVKMVTAVVVLAPMWLGALVSARQLWRNRRRSLLVLGMTLAPILGMFVTLDIFHTANEYKLMFVAAICIVPISALALGQLAGRLGRMGGVVPLLTAAVLAYPALGNLPQDADYRVQPEVDISRFDLRLTPTQPWAAALDAVRAATPVNAVLVSRIEGFDPAAPAQRPVYVPLATTEALLGLGLSPDALLKFSRGYPVDLVDSRRGTVRQLFESGDDAQREQALRRMLAELGRPVALVLARPADAALDAYLAQRGASLVYDGNDSAAWLVVPAAARTQGER